MLNIKTLSSQFRYILDNYKYLCYVVCYMKNTKSSRNIFRTTFKKDNYYDDIFECQFDQFHSCCCKVIYHSIIAFLFLKA